METSKSLSSFITKLFDSRAFIEKLENALVFLLPKLGYGKAHQTVDVEPLQRRISTVHEEQFGERAKLTKVRKEWKLVLLPYVAAYLAGEERELNKNEFMLKFGINVPSSTYSNWTKNYFNGRATECKFLYQRQELVYWWKHACLTEKEIEGIIQDLQKKELL